MPVSMMEASNVNRSTIAAQSRGSVKVRAHLAERGVARDRDAGAFLPLGEHLKQQLRAAPVELEIAELVEAKQVNSAVAGDGLGQVLVVGGLDELVDQRGGGDVADLEPGLGGGGAQPDQQVALAGAGVADQADRLPGADPGALGQGVDQCGRDVRVRGEVEVLDAFRAREAGLLDQSGLAADLAVLALDEQQLRQEPLVGGLLPGRGGGLVTEPVADGRAAAGSGRPARSRRRRLPR